MGDALIEDCPAGGTTIASGLDTDADGTLSELEVQSSRILCNGVDGLSALVGQVAIDPGPDCPGGGFELKAVKTSISTDSSTSRRSPKARLSAYRSPQAAPAQPGRAFPGDDPACPSGGIRLESGLDDDADGLLSPEEVAQVQFICNGIDGTSTHIETLTLEPGDLTCPNGGTIVYVWQDLDFNGLRTDEETQSSQTICAGIDGVDGLSTFTQLTPLTPDETCPEGGVLIELDSMETKTDSWTPRNSSQAKPSATAWMRHLSSGSMRPISPTRSALVAAFECTRGKMSTASSSIRL